MKQVRQQRGDRLDPCGRSLGLSKGFDPGIEAVE
jgi:hypothetical protein